MTRYAMVIDLKKCIGCMTCSIACKVENGTRPGIFWIQVRDQEFGRYPEVKRMFLPIQCAHCVDPPCVEVCPTEASYQREDGIVLVDHDKCVGCKLCIDACPYGVRCFNADETGYFSDRLTPMEAIVYKNHVLNVAEKCTFCTHRIREGLQPVCVEACIGKARFFGDLDDSESEIVHMIETKSACQLKKKLGAEPMLFYIMPW